MLSALAAAMGRTARVALRVNPDVDAGTHAKITTGRAQDKFGIPYADAVALYRRAARPAGHSSRSDWRRISAARSCRWHLIAPPTRVWPNSCAHCARTDCRWIRSTAAAASASRIATNPRRCPPALAGAMRGALHDLDVRIVLEPGRWLVGPAGVLLASVILAKHAQSSRFIVLDAAMNDLVRPAMYDAWHGIVPVAAVDAVAPMTPADVVGPVCESGDTFARDRMLPALASGARVAILDAGAYGSVMSSAYNARPLAAEVMVDGSDVVGDPRARQPRRLVACRTRATLARNERPGRRPRSPAAPACRPPRPGSPRHPVRTHLAGALACRSASRGCSSAPPCSICRVCCRPGRISACSPPPALLIVGLLVRGLQGIAAPDDKAADRRLEVASGLPHRPLVGADRPAVARRQRTRYRVGRAVAGACCPRGTPGAPAACRRAASRPGAARPACPARRAGGRPGRRLRDRRRRCALATGAGDGTDPAARDAAAGNRAAGLDHAAGLYRGWRRSSSGRTAGACRCRPAPASRSASPAAARTPTLIARRAVGAVSRAGQGKLPGRPRPDTRAATSRYGATDASWRRGTWPSSPTSRRQRTGPTIRPRARKPADTAALAGVGRLRRGLAAGRDAAAGSAAMHRPWWLACRCLAARRRRRTA